MRTRFEEQLAGLSKGLIEMGALCERAISNAIMALFEGRTYVSLEEEIDQKEREIETMCLKLLLQQQPVARDLRQISSALKMITDMERIGDQAEDIADIVHTAGITSPSLTIHLKEMAEAAQRMVTGSVDAYVRRDLLGARNVIESDDIVDALFVEVRAEIVELIIKDIANAEFAIDLMMIAKYLERIADHATNIAEWAEFSIVGEHRIKE